MIIFEWIFWLVFLPLLEHTFSKECESGHFGSGCKRVCHCKNRGNCHYLTGKCQSEGCDPGWTGDSCSKECEDFRFGKNCGYSCKCLNKTEVCHKRTGECPISGLPSSYRGDNYPSACQDHLLGVHCFDHCFCEKSKGCTLEADVADKRIFCEKGCLAGWKGDYCSQNCSDSEFGHNCKWTCHCKNGEACDDVTGKCKNGCAAGWLQDNCAQECEDFRFGKNCGYSCKCLNKTEVCHKRTGECPISGLPSSYRGDNYPSACQDHLLGVHCFDHCFCEKSKGCTLEADVADKRIFCEKGCLAGWKGDYCSQNCSDSEFGHNCKWTCHCKNGEACDDVTGKCKNGCAAGWLQDNCAQECEDFRFGKNCGYSCKCLNKTEVCHKRTGECPISGLPSSYRGDNYPSACQDHLLGVHCFDHCFCEKSKGCTLEADVADKRIFCEKGCLAGWKGDYCSQNCSDSEFGHNCKWTCHCKNGEACDDVTGKCKNGCAAGWLQDNCAQECEDFRFGENCGYSCNCLNKTEVCHKRTGECPISGLPSSYRGDNYPSEQNEKVFTYQALVYVIVAIALLSVLLFLLVSLLVYKKKCSLEQAKSCSLISTKEEDQCTVINPGTVYPDLFAYINTSTTVDVKVTDQWDFVLQKLNSPAIMTEFKTLLPGLIHPHNVGKMLENKPKNRFQTILPYDHQRVVLDVTDSFTSDYINASYIDGYNKQNRYIATQGPSPDTIVDFWRMVWQTHAEKIVVLVNLQEIKSHGCAKYWPEIGKKLIYGSIEVSTVATVMYADFLIRKIKISMAETSRFIHQYHFKKWQDHGVPYYSTDLVKFRNKICSTSSENNSPIIVHCRAGIGRTGTFIALDILVDEGLQQGHVDILQCVQKLRQQRVSMVQNEMQYKFLHAALLESLLFCGTEISVCDFINVLPQIQNTSISGNFHKRMVEEYWKLKRYRVHKERQQSNFDVVDEKIYEIIDEKTPSQMKHLDNHKLAVNLSSYTQNNLFIVIQTPPEEMAAKFWEKVYKRKSQIVVMLDDCRTKEVVTRKYGSICMKVISKEEREHFTKAYIQLNNMHATKEWFVTVFHFLCWPNDHKLPAGVSIFLNFVVEVMNCHKKVKMPIVVHCLLAFDIVFLLTLNVLLAAAVLRRDNIFRNGYKKTGLLCAVWNIIDMVEVDGVISVLQTVRSMNMVKWEFIGNYEQYEFCYKAIAQHLRNQ